MSGCVEGRVPFAIPAFGNHRLVWGGCVAEFVQSSSQREKKSRFQVLPAARLRATSLKLLSLLAVLSVRLDCKRADKIFRNFAEGGP